MIKKVSDIYNSAIQDVSFKKDVYNADCDVIAPTDVNNEKCIVASIYYGYLVGKYGNNWKKQIKVKV